jgi:peptide/nickel transport system substrate-binding protein
MSQQGDVNWFRWNLNRRELISAFGLATMTAMLGACGGSDDDDAVDDAVTTSVAGGSAAPTVTTAAAATTETTTSQSEPKQGGSLICSYMFDSNTAPNPLLAGGNYLLWSRLFKFDRNLTPIPDLADGFEISEDRLVYTIHLRENAKWHDGKPVTADDVVFTVQQDLAPDSMHPLASYFKVNGEPIQAAKVDDYTVTLTVPEPYAPLIAHLAVIWTLPIAPKHLLEGVDPQTADFNNHPIGSGPFQFKELVPGDHLTLTRFDDYYFGAPLLDEVIIRIMPDTGARLAAFQAGEIDLDLREEDLIVTKQFEETDGAKAYYLDTPFVQQLSLKNDDPLFTDLRVRQAISHALDKPNMVRTVIGDEQYTAWEVVGKVHWAWEPNVTRYEYDPEKAKQLLDEAGWVVGSDNVREKDGQKFVFTFHPWRPFEQNYAPVIQQFLKAVGIQMDLQVVPDGASMQALRRGGEAQSIISGSINYEPSELYSSFHSSQFPPDGANIWFYQNTEVDALLEAGQTEIDQEKRAEIYRQVQRLIADDVPTIPLHYHVNNEIVRADRVAGFPEPAGNWNGVLYQEPWKIYKLS